MLPNVKMPTLVGILTFMSRISFVLSWVEHEKSFITLGPGETVVSALNAYQKFAADNICKYYFWFKLFPFTFKHSLDPDQVLICIQTFRHADSVLEQFFYKVDFEESQQTTTKAWEIIFIMTRLFFNRLFNFNFTRLNNVIFIPKTTLFLLFTKILHHGIFWMGYIGWLGLKKIIPWCKYMRDLK